jgi:membrane associated rhomboid family serine protease
MMEWRNLDRLPEGSGETWQARRGRGRVFADKRAIDAAVAKWNLFDPLMICPPGGRRFLPVLAVEEYRETAQRALLRRQLVGVGMLLLLAGGLAVSAWITGRPRSLNAAFVALVVAGFAVLEYQVSLKRPEALFDRAMLGLWVADRGRAYAVGWSAAMLAAGALQLVGLHVLGGQEALLLKLGAVHDRILGGELWRLLIGPFLHADAFHWLTNLACLIFAGAVSGALLGRASILLFLAASSGGALASALLSGSAVEVYVGVSAGIFALLAWCGGAALRRPHAFPRYFAATALGFLAVSLISAWVLNPEASNVGHAAGLVFGFAWGVACPGGRAARPSRGREVTAAE